MIFHIATKLDWEIAQELGFYKTKSLITDGFIHCSTRDQLIPVANFLYKGKKDLILLYIDEAKVNIRYSL